jgi:hypothetical protein
MLFALDTVWCHFRAKIYLRQLLFLQVFETPFSCVRGRYDIRDVALHNIGSMQARILDLNTRNVSKAVKSKLYLERLWNRYNRRYFGKLSCLDDTQSVAFWGQQQWKNIIFAKTTDSPTETRECPNRAVGLALKGMKFGQYEATC